MHTLIWVASGLLAGWLAGRLARDRGYGLLADLVLGLLGGGLGGWVVRLSGVTSRDVAVNHVAPAFLGAVVLLGVARLLRPVAAETRRRLVETPVGTDLETRIRQLGHLERQLVDRMLRRDRGLRSANVAFDEQLTLGQRVADRVASFGGSWRFIGIFAIFMLGWMIINTETMRRFDPYPFILLNLLLSCLAAMQAPVIMMSQNRQAAKDRLDAQHDYEVNLHAEMQIEGLHAKLEALQETAWVELMQLQQRQIELLEEIAARTRAE